MQRRLLLTITGAVAAAVTIVGLGTLVLASLDTRHRDEDELARRLEALAAVVAEVRPVRVRPVTERLEPTLDVDSLRIVRLDAPPSRLDAGEVDDLEAGRTISGRDGRTAYAAAPLPVGAASAPARALLAEDTSGANLGTAGRWFVVAGAATVGLGALAARRMARSLAGPLVSAESATRHIAAGDLTVRVPAPAHTDTDDELSRLVRSINAMAASLEDADRREQDFLLSVSHDLRTPLTSISGWAEALADGTAPDPAAAGGIVLAESGRLDRLIRDLLDLARLRTRTFTLARQPVDLVAVAAGTAEGLRPDLDDAGLGLVVDVPTGPVEVEGDPDRLAQVAGNLLQNAGHHARSLVRVTVLVDGDRAVLMVDDDGSGIGPDDRPKVFERLHTGTPTSSRPGTGTGLGLAIVRELVQAMDGEVTVSDAPDGGARLEVRLPRRPA